MVRSSVLLILLSVGVTMALYPTYYQPNEESLKTALEAVTRKQRSLELNPEEYYDLHSFKYHGGDSEKRYNSGRSTLRDVGGDQEGIEFLPVDGPDSGQIDALESGFQIQDLNNNILTKALFRYLENSANQAVPSSFRERERNSNYKRGLNAQSIDDRGLIKLFLEGLQGSKAFKPDENYHGGYLPYLQDVYDQYKNGQEHKILENAEPLVWDELITKMENSRRQDEDEDIIESEMAEQDGNQSVLHLIPAERRNVNGRFPLGRDFRTFSNLSKRYSVAKRSPKVIQNNRQVTDPKIARDLGTLFGIQSTERRNETHEESNDVDYVHQHNHENYHKYEYGPVHGGKSSALFKVSSASKGEEEKESKRLNPKEEIIQIRKKNIDWSEYFGLDRRRKKTTFLAKPDTQRRDNEWLLQQYYKTMAEYLKRSTGDASEGSYVKADNPSTIDLRSKSTNDVKIEEAFKYLGPKDDQNSPQAKGRVTTPLAAAYPAEQMRRAFNEFRNNIAAQQTPKRVPFGQYNLTVASHAIDNHSATQKKKDSHNLEGNNDSDENTSCAELQGIKKRCKLVSKLAEDESQKLYVSCIALQTCRACVENDIIEECVNSYAVEAAKICGGQKTKEMCTSKALMILRLQLPIEVIMQCQKNSNDSCLRRYYRCNRQYGYNSYAEQYNNKEYGVIPSELCDQ